MKKQLHTQFTSVIVREQVRNSLHSMMHLTSGPHAQHSPLTHICSTSVWRSWAWNYPLPAVTKAWSPLTAQLFHKLHWGPEGSRTSQMRLTLLYTNLPRRVTGNAMGTAYLLHTSQGFSVQAPKTRTGSEVLSLLRRWAINWVSSFLAALSLSWPSHWEVLHPFFIRNWSEVILGTSNPITVFPGSL